MVPREQEKAIAAMLHKRVADSGAGPATACPAPDILAAYYERSLDADEQARHETHFASCARCQAQLAAMVRAEPEPHQEPRWAWLADWRRREETPAPAAARSASASTALSAASTPAATRSRSGPLRRFEWLTNWRYAWRWLAPAVAIAAALAIWVAVRPPLLQPSNVIEVASTDRSKIPGAVDSLEKRDQRGPRITVAPPPASARELNGEAQLRTPAVRSKRLAANVEQPTAGPAPGPALNMRAMAPPPKRAEPATQAAAPTEEPAAGKPAAADQTVAVETAPEAPAKTMPMHQAKQTPRALMRAQTESSVASGGAQSAGTRINQLEVRSREVMIPSPDPAVRWRVGVAGSIEHSEDGGKTWSGQIVDVSINLLAGSAPTTKICWIVGRVGEVLRTTDGEHWEKVTPPAAVDLVGIEARDAKHATVTAADGRKFWTDDGGKTWRVND